MKERDEQEQDLFADEPKPPVGFPPGATVFEGRPLGEEIFAEVDEILAEKEYDEGRFEIEAPGTRLLCVIHHRAPFLAGMVEGDRFSAVPLRDFVVRASQLKGASCSLVVTDSPLAMMVAMHFYRRPVLVGSTKLVDPAHVLQNLEAVEEDAAIAFERAGKRTLLFLREGVPARLYFGSLDQDPGKGSLEERMLLHAFDPAGKPGKVSVFTNLRLPTDPYEGSSFAHLADFAKPPPPVDLCLSLLDGREIRRRPFTPPEMIVGRDPTVDLFIDNLAVSRRHARVWWEGGAFQIEDMNSANGTFVGGQRIRRRELRIDDQVQIGKFLVSLYQYSKVPAVTETMFLQADDLRRVALSLEGEGESWSLDRDRLLGSGEGVDVRVPGWRVRPVHARIASRGSDLEIVAFGRSGLRVNGKKTRKAALKAGDEIAVGRARYRVTSADL